jgi:hypothetical protein
VAVNSAKEGTEPVVCVFCQEELKVVIAGSQSSTLSISLLQAEEKAIMLPCTHAFHSHELRTWVKEHNKWYVSLCLVWSLSFHLSNASSFLSLLSLFSAPPAQLATLSLNERVVACAVCPAVGLLGARR